MTDLKFDVALRTPEEDVPKVPEEEPKVNVEVNVEAPAEAPKEDEKAE